MTNYIATVYGAPGCQKCRATARLLARAGLTVFTERIHDNPDALNKMQSEGWTALPLVRVATPDGDTIYWNDLNTKKIDEIRQKVSEG